MRLMRMPLTVGVAFLMLAGVQLGQAIGSLVFRLLFGAP
jgi:hypothetical protein